MFRIPNSLKDLSPAYLLGIIGSVVTFAVSMGLISNSTEKFVVGVAAVLIPGGFILVHAVLAELKHASAVTAVNAVISVVALFATQGFIDNNTEKLVTGLASSVIPFLFMIGYAVAAGLSPHVPTRNTPMVVSTGTTSGVTGTRVP